MQLIIIMDSENKQHNPSAFEQAKGFFLRGLESYHRQQYEEAERLLSLSLDILPERLSTLTNIVTVLIKLHKYEKASEILTTAICLYPTDETLYLNQGQLFEINKNWHMSLASYDHAIELKPDYAEAFNNRAIVLKELKRLDDSLGSYKRAIELNPNYVEAYYNRGNALNENNYLVEALNSYDKAIEIKNDYAEAYYNRGIVLYKLKRMDDALASYDKAIELKPDYSEAYYNRGILLQLLERYKEAITSYSISLSINPISTKAKYSLASLGVGDLPIIMPRELVISIFNNYSDNFDNHLISLNYHAPTVLFHQLNRNIKTDFKVTKLLDLGCGTGLSGEAFKNITDTLIGVDLSQGMLTKAFSRGIYEKLYCSDILEFLKLVIEKFNLIVCADVFIYIGDLSDLFDEIKERLEYKGYCSFTIENSESKTYELKNTGRYGHGVDYIKQLSKFYDLRIIDIQQFNLRKDKGGYISGSAILMQKI